MGRSLLLLVALSLLLLHGSDASRSPPTSKQAIPRFHTNANSTLGLIDGVSPQQDSDNPLTYFAFYAATTAADGYHGFIATMDVYGFPLENGQGSAAAVWIHDEADGQLFNLRQIMIGWDVLPSEYGDSRTYFYTKWTNDGFLSTGCTNMKCIGFQPEKGAKIAPGDVIDHVTFPKQKIKRNLNLKVIKDGPSGDWLVYCGLDQDPELIGRFPRSLFTGIFAEKATSISFGGVTTAPFTKPPPMGSGYLPTDPKSAASISNIQFVDQNGRASPVTENLAKFETNSAAYAVSPILNGQFFYGGCQKPTA
ncbi:hypothetical protein EJB05_41418 [Eragrostis curvula]|uniref:Neprosin PEP catalytic domain-containing protein n=1 Tax=Eragrostis curvula TaxID=38414 RepID=A0A5J9T9Q4_9POAL|nr:hypothetical protein EJB05_41418 [Eragrostis curvula]